MTTTLPTPAAREHECGCGCGVAQGPGSPALERTRYQPGMIVTADDLTQDQLHWRERHRRHNRLLHGWGIVCGAGVVSVEGTCAVRVRPGYVLGPWGDEIVIEREVELDVCREDAGGLLSCGDPDPWCSDVVRPRGETLYLAIRHLDCPSRPVRVPGDGCGCDGDGCSYSRTREGFGFAVLDELPTSYRRGSQKDPYGYAAPARASIVGLASSMLCLGGPRTCPPCEEDPWVILADLAIKDGAVSVSCAPNRRYVVAFGHYSFRCDRRTAAAGLGGLASAIGGEAAAPSRLVEVEALRAGEPRTASATVALKLGGRWTTLESMIEIGDGETLDDVLRREGDREYVDTSTGEGYRLSEIYAAVGADRSRPVASVAEALAPLEGRAPDVAGLRVVRGRLDDLLGRDGAARLEEEHAGLPDAAASLPAIDLVEVSSGTPLARVADGKTVGEVAAMARDDFVASVRRRASKTAADEAADAAGRAWDAASAVARLSEGWAAGGGGAG